MMAVGYLIIAIPTPTPVPSMGLYLGLTCLGLLVIAFGNGLFKGNLQALVGQMYDDPKYSSLRDSGFQIFYMFINIGGFFAPWIAIGVRNWWLKVNNFDYDATLPELCHQFLKEGDKMAPQAMRILHRWPIRLRSTAATWLIWVHLSTTTWMCLTVVSNMLLWLPLLPC